MDYQAAMLEGKLCPKCNTTLPISQFYVDRHSKDGRTAYCKSCRNAAVNKYREENRDSHNAYRREYAKSNPQVIRLQSKRAYLRHREQMLASATKHYHENKVSISIKRREHRQAHPEKFNAWTRDRLALKLKRKPKWANDELVLRKYQLAQVMTNRTGIQHVVDHVYPLKGALVSGLHTEANLMVVSADYNLRKSNKLINHNKEM